MTRREIIRTVAGVAYGMDVFGNPLWNRNDASQLFIDTGEDGSPVVITIDGDGNELYLSNGAASTPIIGINTLSLGASREMRGNQTISVNSGGVTLASGTLTVTTNTNHESYTGANWLVVSQADSNDTAFDQKCIGYGEITRTGDATFTIPQALISGYPTTGTSTSQFWAICQQQFTHQSPELAFATLTNGATRPFGNFSAGSNGSSDLEGHCFELAKLYINSFQHMNITLGIGNDVLAAINAGTTIAAMLTATLASLGRMLDYLVANGKTFIIQGIPGSETSSGSTVAYAIAMENAVSNLIRSDYSGKGVYLPLIPLMILPGSTTADPAMMLTGGGVHQNFEGADVVGEAIAIAYESLAPIPDRPPLITSSDDRRSASASSDQLMEAGWAASGSGKAASTLDSDFSGTIMQEFEAGTMTAGSSAASVVFSVNAEPEGYGYSQDYVITSTGGSNTMTLALTGDTGVSSLFDRIVVGSEYEGYLRFSIIPSTATVLDSWSVRVMGNVTYGTSKLCVLAMACGNSAAFPDLTAPKAVEHMLYIPRHKIPVGITTYYIEFKQRLTSSSGTITCQLTRPSLRKVA